MMAEAILGAVAGLFYTMLMVGGVISVLTAFMDNVLAVATMIPVVHSMAEAGVFVDPIWRIMLIGGTYCGNATLIGSTANIVTAGFMEKRGTGSFSMLTWMWIGTLFSLVTFFIAFALLYLQVMLLVPKA